MIERFVDSGQDGAAKRVKPKQCSRCRRLQSAETWTCAAFPDGIPAMILRDRYDHRLAFPGDNGIRFDPLPGERHPLEAE